MDVIYYVYNFNVRRKVCY